MANRLKDEEKNEKIIRGLLKHPANKRCINCNSLGPQYVCTNFWTFICTNCSGLHREFTHRVKSISMAKFTSHEVNALQEGGNERARESFFKEWDPQRHSYPDSSHLDRLRDFIKHVYVDRKYAGGKNIDASQRVKGEYDYDENRRSNTVGNGSRSPPYNESYEHRYGERPGSAGMNDDRSSRSSYEARSPTSDLGDYRSPSRFEMRDEMRQDNKVGNEVQSPQFCDNRVSAGLSKQGVSDNKKGVYISSPPVVRPIREILGGDAPPLRVSDLPLKTNGGKTPNSPQGSTTSSKGSNDGNSVELKGGNLGSLIDFSADPEPPVDGEAQETFPQPSVTTPAKNGGWAFFDVSSQQKAPEVASTVGDLESVFAQFSIPAATPVVNSSLSPASNLDSFPMGNNSGQWPAVQQQPSSFPTTSNMSAIKPINVPVGSLPIQGSVAVLDGQTALPVVHSPHRPAAVGYSQNPPESKANGRKELPVDLFSGLNPAPFASYPGWRMGPGHNLVYNMQNPVMMQPTSTVYNPPASMNPFDLANDSSPAANHLLHPSVSLQGALPNSYPLSLPKSSNLSTVPSQWAPQQFSYPLSVSAGPYMVQQPSHGHQPPGSSFPTLNQGVVSANDQLLPGTNPLPGSLQASLPSSISGNPFG